MSGPRTLEQQSFRLIGSVIESAFLVGVVLGIAMLVVAWIVLPLLWLFGYDPPILSG